MDRVLAQMLPPAASTLLEAQSPSSSVVSVEMDIPLSVSDLAQSSVSFQVWTVGIRSPCKESFGNRLAHAHRSRSEGLEVLSTGDSTSSLLGVVAPSPRKSSVGIIRQAPTYFELRNCRRSAELTPCGGSQF